MYFSICPFCYCSLILPYRLLAIIFKNTKTMFKKIKEYDVHIYYFAFCYLFFCLYSPLYYAYHGIDASWSQSLIIAIEKGKVFGKEFVFNYGPLGFLNTGLLPRGFSPLIFIFYHLFVLFSIFFILRLLLEKLGNYKWLAYFLILLFIYPFGFFADATFSLMYMGLFWQNYYFQKPKAYKLILFSLCIIILIPIKLNLSLIAIIYFLSVLIYAFFMKIGPRLNLVYSIFLFVIGIGLISYLLKFDIFASIKCSADIINAYQDSMATVMVTQNEKFFFLILAIISGSIFLLIFLLNFKNLLLNLFFGFWIGIIWFLNYKQAFTALAKGNLSGFLSFIIPLSILVFLFLKRSDKKFLNFFLFSSVLISVCGNYYIKLSDNNFENKTVLKSFFHASSQKSKTFVSHLLSIPFEKTPLPYFEKLLNYNYEKNFEKNTFVLPDSIKNTIGKKTVDIIPWDISYLFINKLNYDNRPVIQSYQANSHFLMNLNGDKYWSKKSPEFVIASVKPFREQNIFWTDTWCHAALYQNYSLIKHFVVNGDSLYLFEKNKTQIPKKMNIIKEAVGNLGERLTISSLSKKVVLIADVEYDTKGKLEKIAFQPPYLMCEIITNSGHKSVVRIPPSILKGGIIVSDLIENNQDFHEFHYLKNNYLKKIKSLKFYSAKQSGFKSKFEYSIVSIN